jgi:ankyrin repeat protein
MPNLINSLYINFFISALLSNTNMILKVKTLLESNLNPNSKDSFGNTAIFYIDCFKSTDEILRVLIDKGVSFNIKNNEGQTFLIYGFI